MLCAKFGWKCPSGIGEDFKKFSIMYFCYFSWISTLRRAWPFIWKKKLESSSPKNALSQVWLKLAQWFWRRRFLKVVNSFFPPIISPLGKAWSFIWINWNPLHPGILCAKFGWDWSSGSGEKTKMWKVYRQTEGQMDGQTDDGRQVIRKAHLILRLRWAKTFLSQLNSQCLYNMYMTVYLYKKVVEEPSSAKTIKLCNKHIKTI